jgi:hypothetical protein
MIINLRPGDQEIEALVAPDGIEVVAPRDVGVYLDAHPDLAQLVPALCARARREFGTDAELILEVYHDPEIDDHYLSLEVRLPSYDETIMERIASVSEPFDEQLCQASGYFLVNTSFRTPRANHGV